MRHVSFILGSLLGLAGCSTGAGMPDIQSPATGTATYRHYTHAALLQFSIMNRPQLDLLDEKGEELVLDLARAQNCLASRTGNMELAEKTQTLLTAYVELHEDHGSEPSPAFHRRARRASIDAVATQQGTASSYFLGCSMRRPSSGIPRGVSPSAGGVQRDYYGIGLPWNQRARSVSGGVIR